MVNGWLLYMITAFITAFLTVPIKSWKELWSAGITGMICILLIDSTLVSLQAFQFVHTGARIFGLPIPYWISYFCGGIIFAYYRPYGVWKRLLYVIGFAVFLWLLEYMMILLGFFQHLHWTLLNSLLLNIIGFTLIFGLYEWLKLAHRENKTRQA